MSVAIHPTQPILRNVYRYSVPQKPTEAEKLTPEDSYRRTNILLFSSKKIHWFDMPQHPSRISNKKNWPLSVSLTSKTQKAKNVSDRQSIELIFYLLIRFGLEISYRCCSHSSFVYFLPEGWVGGSGRGSGMSLGWAFFFAQARCAAAFLGSWGGFFFFGDCGRGFGL